MIARGKFREDLYYRIAEFPVELPPLRERGGDVELLARHFMERYGGKEFTPGALYLLKSYSWPGNIREMRNHIRRACINSTDGVITAELLELSPTGESRIPTGSLLEESAMAAKKREYELISRALKETDGNRSRAADLLGVSYRTLLNKLKEMEQKPNG